MENKNTKILKELQENSELSLVQGAKFIESVNGLEPAMEGMLVKTNELVEEQKKTNELLSKEEKPEVQKVKLEGIEVITLKGDKGEKGDTGEQGIQGERGERGGQGIQGEKGDVGEKGERGEKGETGETGPIGPKGDKGDVGPQGKTGKQGSSDTPEQVKSKLLEAGIDYEEIKNAPDIENIVSIVRQSSKTGSLSELDDVNLSGLTQTNGKYNLGSGGGGGSSVSVNGAEVTDPDFIESPEIKLVVNASEVSFVIQGDSIDESKLDTSVNASLDLADAALPASLYDDATAAETNTGTSTAKYVSPDGLAGSYAGTKSISVPIVQGNILLTTGDAKGGVYFRVPPALNGMNLVGVGAAVLVTSSSGNPTIQVARGRQANATSAHTFADMLSTRITIDSGEYDSANATAAAIDASNDDVLTGDLIRFDVDVSGTGTQGLIVNLEFRLP